MDFEEQTDTADFAVRVDPDGARVVVDGELDIATGALLLTAVGQLPEPDPSHRALLVDVSGLTFADIAGLRVLEKVVLLRRAHGQATRLTGMRAEIRRTLDFADLTDVIDSLGEAAC